MAQAKSFWDRDNLLEIAGLLILVFVIRTFGFGLYQVPTGSMETSMLVGERFFADKLSYVFRDPKHGEVIAFNEPETMYKYSKNPFKNFMQHYVWGPSNFTKRIIGVPGDVIEGKIEGDKPVIYRNGKKLDEPHLNAYPLISTWDEDPIDMQNDLNNILHRLKQQGVTEDQLDRYGAEYSHRHQRSPKSYDPNKSFSEQPFYRIDPTRVIYNEDGKMNLIWPATPSRSRSGSTHHEGKNYWDGSDEFRVELGSKQYWMMGDNRLGSSDSRFFGPVDRSFIHGKILFRIWSHDSDYNWWIFDLLAHPIDFWKRMRWGRFFQFVS